MDWFNLQIYMLKIIFAIKRLHLFKLILFVNSLK